MSLPRAAFGIICLSLLSCCSFPFTLQAQHPAQIDTSGLLAANGGKALHHLDGRLVVSAILTNEQVITITNPHQEAPYFSTISDDGRWLFYSVKTKTEKITYVHDLTNNGELKHIFPFALEAVASTNDGRKVFFIHSKTFWKANLSAYDTTHWQLLGVRSVTDLTSSIAVNADGSQLLAAARSIVRVIDPQTLKTQRVHWETSRLGGLVYNPADANQYASINHKNVIEVRDLVEDRVVHTIRTGKGKITQLGYAPDGKHLMSIDDAGHLDVWDLQSHSRLVGLDNVVATDGFEEGNLAVLNQEGWRSIQEELAARRADHTLAQPDVAFQGGPTNKVGMVPIPIIAYSPETSLLLGFGMNFIFHPREDDSVVTQRFFRPSSLTPSISYGFNGQLQASVTADYFSKRGWHFFNQVGFLKNNRSYFFGLGNDAERKSNTAYHNHVFSWEGELTKSIGDHFFAGINYQIRNDSRLDFNESDPFAVPNSEGGFLAGIGPVARFDTRNDVFFPTAGYYVDLSLTRYGKWLGSDYGYSDLKLDYRGFHALPILTAGTTFAVQALYHGTFNGDAPFYQLPYLSADRILRGVWRNLYIDRQAVALQGELRSNFSNVDPRYAYVVFAGAGDVAPNFFEDYEPNITGVFGVGLRQQVIPKLRLQSRVDFSVTTKGNIGIFGGVGLAF